MIITRVAATLFYERGFDSVRMEDIASASGVTVKALYRHFDSKLALLTHLIDSSQQRFIDSLTTVTDVTNPADQFEAAVRQLADASAQTSHFSALWQREARNLAPEDFSRLRGRLNSLIASLSRIVGHADPHLSEFRRDLIAWGVIACVSAPGSTENPDLARRSAMALLTAGEDSGLRVATIDRHAIVSDVDVSRRERILAAAAITFNLSGFSATKTGAIGSIAGVSGPSLYRHFGTKSELLDTLVSRGEALLWYETSIRRLPGQSAPERLCASSDALITSTIRSPDLVGIWITERFHVSEPTAKAVAASLAAFQATLATDLLRVRTDLTRQTCAQLVRIAVQIVDDIVRIGRLRRDPALAGELSAMVAAVFGVRVK